MRLQLMCRNVKGLLNFVRERIKHVYGKNLLGTALKNQHSFKLISKYQLLSSHL